VPTLYSWIGAAAFSAASAILASTPAVAENANSPGDRVFGTAKVAQFHLTLDDKQFTAMTPANSPAFGPPGSRQPRRLSEGSHRNTFGVEFSWVHGELSFNDKSLADVAVRYKGNYTYMASARLLKKSLKVDLNRFVAGQKLDGLTMLNFHCGVSDPFQLREAMSYAIFRDANVPAPRTSFAELTLTVPGKYDRELVGLFTLVEQVNRHFLERHFEDGRGMLLKPENLQGGPVYLGTDWTNYEVRYRPEKTASKAQQQRLIDFTRLISRGSDASFASDIGSFLDVDAFLKFIAVNALMSNLDSYLGYGHNYYLYLVPKTDRFVFIPWDLDLSLATWPAAGTPEQLVQLSLRHPHAGQDALLDRLFAIEEIKTRYWSIVEELAGTLFTRANLLRTLNEIERAIQEPMAREAKAAAARHENRAGAGTGFGMGRGQYGQSMPPRKFIQLRTESITAQLAGRAKGFEPKPFGGARGGGSGAGGLRPRPESPRKSRL
jgi:spore coat protein CotH